ncbi:MAG: undecaprenyl-phosphate glucose phosphotransferase [Eubacteriales bacterium]|nr:undecaprenyl-phosphate glucose phosphotransferase [Eubacteriales bacterium]
MEDNNQKLINRIQLLLDILVIAGSYLLAWLIQFELIRDETTGKLPFSVYMTALVCFIPGTLFLYYAFNLYTSKRVQGRRLEISNIIKANTIVVLVFLSVSFLMKEQMIDFSRKMVFIFYVLNIFFEILVRNLMRMALTSIWRKGINVRQMVLVGYSRAAEEYIDRINQNPQWGYRVRGILDDNVERGTMYKGVKVIGRIENLNVILPFGSLDEIAITLGLSEYYKLEHIVALCEKSGVHTKFIPDYNNIIPTKPYTEDLMGLPVINIRHVPLSNSFNKMIKRTMDIVGGLLALVVFSPVMLIAAILVKATSKGPLIYKQERVGLHNKPFNMYKFRSMEVQEESKEKSCWTTKNDPRVTTVGKLMRRTSIDELPQIINVLKGDMSLVGPRPERPQFVEKFREEIPRYMVKHQVRPGMTGWAQVNGFRGDTSIRKRIDCDLYYIENWTVGMDLKIILMTFFKGFVNKNAY